VTGDEFVLDTPTVWAFVADTRSAIEAASSAQEACDYMNVACEDEP
jgi:hypothetical protein